LGGEKTLLIKHSQLERERLLSEKREGVAPTVAKKKKKKKEKKRKKSIGLGVIRGQVTHLSGSNVVWGKLPLVQGGNGARRFQRKGRGVLQGKPRPRGGKQQNRQGAKPV